MQRGDETNDGDDLAISLAAPGPVFIKRGQALLIRPGSVPESYITALQPCCELQTRLVASGLRFR